MKNGTTNIGDILNINDNVPPLHAYTPEVIDSFFTSAYLPALNGFAADVDKGAHNGKSLTAVHAILDEISQNAVRLIGDRAKAFENLKSKHPRKERREWARICRGLHKAHLNRLAGVVETLRDFLRSNCVDVPDPPL